MYAILRTKKLKDRSAITQATEHNLRLRTQRNVDSSRSHLNKILYNALDIDSTEATDFQRKLGEYYTSLGVKEKKGNVLAYEYVVTASPEFFKDKSNDFIQKWADEQVRFMEREFGTQLKFGVVHLDEKTPHMHFFVSTENKSVKKYRNQKGDFFKESWSLNSRNINPEYLADLQTRFAQNNAKFGLKRGAKGSRIKHIPMKNFYRTVDRIMARSYADQVNEVINGIELSIGERLSIDVIRRKIYECLYPILKSTLRERKIYREFSKLNFHKLQAELIEERKHLALELNQVSEVKEVYKEAINGRLQDIQVTEYLLEQNSSLAEQLAEMRMRYEPGSTVSGDSAIPQQRQ
ncbi:plasmid recombination protein [Burkholderia vietnamiensis]|uniref:MobV family relaxase n=1 Tax=Burkholderia vietnamiensis TaxID=60552 RepID=UPI001BA009ED|nr:MobV family relaxase [Burkholderia vietnamiensis]MBR7917869.1 plasmid recombination protein [Burkholderia vietnamiensis]